MHAEPVIFGGSFDLLSFIGDKTVGKIATLGHEGEGVVPIVTYTTGYENGERFGNPHAVFSSKPGIIQICAFLAISPEVHSKYPYLWRSLNPQYPIPTGNN